MAITYDSVGSAANAAAAGTISWGHTIVGTTNGLLTVSIGADGTFGVTNVAFAGQNLTKLIDSTVSSNSQTTLLYLKNPPIGLGTINGTITGGPPANIAGISIAYQGINQTAPFAGSVAGSASAATSGSITLALNGPSNWFTGANNDFDQNNVVTNIGNQRGTVLGPGGGVLLGADSTGGTLRWTQLNSRRIIMAGGALQYDGGSIAFDATGTFGQNSGSVYSFAHTVTGANTLMTLLVENGVAGSTVSVKFAGQAMTRIIIGTNSSVMELFYLVNPPTGLGTINGTLDQTNIFKTVCVSNSFTGVNQTTPIGGSAVALAASVSSGSISLTMNNDTSWMAGGLGLTTAVAGTEDVTTGEVSRGTATATNGEIRAVTNGPISPAGAGTFRWTSAAATYIMLAAEVNAATSAAPQPQANSIGYRSQMGIGY